MGVKPFPRNESFTADQELQYVKEAAEEVVYAWTQFAKATTVVDQATWVEVLNNKVFDLSTWAPVRYDDDPQWQEDSDE